MMRSGRLLTEDSPENLLSKHNLSSLEDVFLKLCMKNDVDDGNSPAVPSTSRGGNDQMPIPPSLARARQEQSKISSIKRPSRVFRPSLPSFYRTGTLAHKNFVQTFRNFGSVGI